MNKIKHAAASSLRYLSSSRFLMAGPMTLITAIFSMAAMSLWLPVGQSEINHLVLPLVLFPLIWSAIFFYTILESDIKRAWSVMFVLLLINAFPVIASILGWLK